MNEKSFWQFSLDSINRGHKLVLLTVADSSKSSPGRQGFKMLLQDDGNQVGTIGGGIMEKQLIEYSLNFLNGKESATIKRLQHSGQTDLEKSGLICGGFQTILLTLIDVGTLPVIKSILENISQRENGTLELTSGEFQYINQSTIENDITFKYESDNSYVYKENLGFTDTVYIAGGGHVGLAVSRIMQSIGFYVIVFDHRENIFTMDNNTFADEKIVSEYKDIGKYIKEGDKSYVVITTPMHLGDRETLGSVLNLNLKYIGMMGSSKKIRTTFDALLERGFDQSKLDMVHSPIGLEIYAETPEEIAISIAAEIIKVKRNNN